MFTIAALYHFTPFADPARLRGPLLETCKVQGVMGTLSLKVLRSVGMWH